MMGSVIGNIKHPAFHGELELGLEQLQMAEVQAKRDRMPEV